MYNKKSRKPLKIRLSGFFYCFVIATDDETQTMLTDTACLLRVVADAVQKPEDDRTASDYDVSRSLFLAAALVDLGATALDAQQGAQFLCNKETR